MDIIISELETIINTYTALLKNLTEEKASHKPLQGKWSKKEIIGHRLCTK